MDLRHIDFCARANRGSGILGNLARFGKSLSRGKLNFEPLGELVRVTPNMAHFLARVSWNQLRLLNAEQRIGSSFFKFLLSGYRSSRAHHCLPVAGQPSAI